MTDIKAIIKKIDTLAPIPQVAHKFLDASRDKNRSMKELSKIIRNTCAILFGSPIKGEFIETDDVIVISLIFLRGSSWASTSSNT